MVKPHFSYPATRFSILQHPYRIIYAIALVVAGPLYFDSPASAALNCTLQPSCAELGYSQTIEEGCTQSLKCPFDQTYQICLHVKPTVSCPEGYSKDLQSVSDCGIRGNDGWIFESTQISDGTTLETCGKCTAKVCPAGSSTVAYCVVGATVVTTGYSGDGVCKKCEEGSCSAGYVKNVSDCGTSGSEGWMLGNIAESGKPDCFRCYPRTCPSGFDTDVFCKAGQEILRKGYSGDKQCIQCFGNVDVTPPIIGKTECIGPLCKYDCSNLGGPKCTDTPTYSSSLNGSNKDYCLRCTNMNEPLKP